MNKLLNEKTNENELMNKLLNEKTNENELMNKLLNEKTNEKTYLNKINNYFSKNNKTKIYKIIILTSTSILLSLLKINNK